MHELIGKFLAGEANDKERKIVEDWRSKSPENCQEFEIQSKVWNKTKIKLNYPDEESMFNEILNKIDESHEEELGNHGIKQYSSRRIVLTTMKVAALFLLIATISLYFYYSNSEREGSDKIVALVEKINPSGQKSKIYLPDGSEVVLNAESKIYFPEEFADSVRTVTLEGEAFFDVIKKTDQPFIVRTGNINTTVLGTTFNIRAFDDDLMIHIALKEGKVKVDMEGEGSEKSVFLAPGEVVEFNKGNSTLVKQSVNLDDFFMWKDGIIVFKDAGLDEIVRKLSRWYGVQIEIKNRKLDNWTYTGTFDNENLENVLRGISFSEDFSYKIDQKNVIIIFS